MNSGDSIPNFTQEPTPSGANSQSLARAALILSIFAFLPPLGLAAIVMGHIAEKRALAPSDGGSPMARAALWIAYIQVVLVLSTTFILWTGFHGMALSFQRDALVQGFLRSDDKRQPLDHASAVEAEQTARTILVQLIAIEDQYRRDNKDGLYACHVSELVEGGLEGTTEAEKRAFDQRILDSPYIFEISGCNLPSQNPKEDSKEAAYILSAVPRHPRMPEGSAIYCADQTGTVRQARHGTSLDCLASGTLMP
jgi:hypothetical protein